jgi:hypothetical protein
VPLSFVVHPETHRSPVAWQQHPILLPLIRIIPILLLLPDTSQNLLDDPYVFRSHLISFEISSRSSGNFTVNNKVNTSSVRNGAIPPVFQRQLIQANRSKKDGKMDSDLRLFTTTAFLDCVSPFQVILYLFSFPIGIFRVIAEIVLILQSCQRRPIETIQHTFWPYIVLPTPIRWII